MGVLREPKPVKLFLALLSSEASLLFSLGGELDSLFGPVDHRSELFTWNLTDYYAEEMGTGLLRRFVAFGPLISPDLLKDIKLQAQVLEKKYLRPKEEGKGRRVNIDPGYLTKDQVVLASTKEASHRIYLGLGIYAEATLHFRSGSFAPWDYTYPDYRWPQTLAFFTALRGRYLDQLRGRK